MSRVPAEKTVFILTCDETAPSPDLLGQTNKNELGGGPKAILLRTCLPVRGVRRSGPETVLCHPVVPRVRSGPAKQIEKQLKCKNKGETMGNTKGDTNGKNEGKHKGKLKTN